ncbi:MAG: glycosyltransferase family 1 protein [Candidatus Shapirobacteria bacterium]
MTPHLVIDARLYGSRHTGIGRYTKNLLLALNQLPAFRKYNVSILVYPEIEDEIRLDLGNRFNYVVTKIRHYTFSEQLLLPFVLYSLRPTLVHFTHFNKPLLYLGKSVVTIHDLIKHFSLGPDTTTRSPALYHFKHIGYRLLTWWVIKTTSLIVPSEFWRQFILKHYQVSPNSVTTTHEAVDPKFLSSHPNPPKPPTKPYYLLYIGNLYPHKNVKVILEALPLLPNFKLYLIGQKNIFTDRLLATAKNLGVHHQINLLGYLNDSQFTKIYAAAFCLVHPSLLEGFSLTGLEAMALNCPVIAARASCLPEVYGDSVMYFNPTDPQDLVNQITRLLSTPTLRANLISKGKKQVDMYSWTKTASQTLTVYRSLLSSN